MIKDINKERFLDETKRKFVYGLYGLVKV